MPSVQFHRNLTDAAYQPTLDFSITLDATETAYVNTQPAYDAAGNLTFDGTFAYEYDACNRLTKATKAYRNDDDSLGPPTYNIIEGAAHVAFTYDALGRRYKKAVRLGSDIHSAYSDLDGDRYYSYHGNQVVQILTTSNAQVRGYAWGLLYEDELISIQDGAGNKYAPMHDANWNVMGLTSLKTGAMTERYE